MDQLLSIFDLYYICSTVLVTYVTIKTIDGIDKSKPLPQSVKETITVVCSLILAFIFLHYNWSEGKSLIPSFFASVIAYSKLIKPILKVLNLGYID